MPGLSQKRGKEENMTDDLNNTYIAVCYMCKQVRKYTDDFAVQANYHEAQPGELDGKKQSHGLCPACNKAMWLKEFGKVVK